MTDATNPVGAYKRTRDTFTDNKNEQSYANMDNGGDFDDKYKNMFDEGDENLTDAVNVNFAAASAASTANVNTNGKSVKAKPNKSIRIDEDDDDNFQQQQQQQQDDNDAMKFNMLQNIHNNKGKNLFSVPKIHKKFQKKLGEDPIDDDESQENENDDEDSDNDNDEQEEQNHSKNKQTKATKRAVQKQNLKNKSKKTIQRKNVDEDDDDDNNNDNDSENDSDSEGESDEGDEEQEQQESNARHALKNKTHMKEKQKESQGKIPKKIRQAVATISNNNNVDNNNNEAEQMMSRIATNGIVAPVRTINNNNQNNSNNKPIGSVLAPNDAIVPCRSDRSLRMRVQFAVPSTLRTIFSRANKLRLDELPIRFIKSESFTGIIIHAVEKSKVALLHCTLNACKVTFFNDDDTEDTTEDIQFDCVININTLFAHLADLTPMHVVDFLLYRENNTLSKKIEGLYVDYYLNQRQLNEDRLFVPFLQKSVNDHMAIKDFKYDYSVEISIDLLQGVIKKATSNTIYNSEVITIEILEPINLPENCNLNILVLRFSIKSEINGEYSKKIVSASEVHPSDGNSAPVISVSKENSVDPRYVEDDNLKVIVKHDFTADYIHKFLQNMRNDTIRLQLQNNFPLVITYLLDGSDTDSKIQFLIVPRMDYS